MWTLLRYFVIRREQNHLTQRVGPLPRGGGGRGRRRRHQHDAHGVQADDHSNHQQRGQQQIQAARRNVEAVGEVGVEAEQLELFVQKSDDEQSQTAQHGHRRHLLLNQRRRLAEQKLVQARLVGVVSVHESP